MQGPRDLEHLFATCTIGEAATATLVSNETPDDDFYFKFLTFGEHVGLSVIPLPAVAEFHCPVPPTTDTSP